MKKVGGIVPIPAPKKGRTITTETLDFGNKRL